MSTNIGEEIVGLYADMHSAYFEQYADTIPPEPWSEREKAASERLRRTALELRSLFTSLRGTRASVVRNSNASSSTIVFNRTGDLHCNIHVGSPVDRGDGFIYSGSTSLIGCFNYFALFAKPAISSTIPPFYSAEVIGNDGVPLVTIDVERT